MLTRFSAKESLYKALDPFLQRYVRFQEAEVSSRPDGSSEVTLLLSSPAPALSARAAWMLHGAHLITFAKIL